MLEKIELGGRLGGNPAQLDEDAAETMEEASHGAILPRWVGHLLGEGGKF